MTSFLADFQYFSMTSFFHGFFSLDHHVLRALFIVFPRQPLVNLIYAQFVFGIPVLLSGNLLFFVRLLKAMFSPSRFSCLTDHSLWTGSQ